MSSRPELFKQNTRRRSLLLPQEREPHPVCSVWPDEVIFSPRPLCPQRIAGRKPGERYAKAMVGTGFEIEDLGNATQTAFESISTRAMALDLIGLSDGGVDQYENPIPVVKSSHRYEQGLFVPKEKTPSEDEILAAEQRMLRFMQRSLQDGDVAFAVAKNPMAVPNEARIAARYLGVVREWSAPAKAAMKVPCPVCIQTEIVQGAQKCLGCNSLIRWEGTVPFWADGPASRAEAPVVHVTSDPPHPPGKKL